MIRLTLADVMPEFPLHFSEELVEMAKKHHEVYSFVWDADTYDDFRLNNYFFNDHEAD